VVTTPQQLQTGTIREKELSLSEVFDSLFLESMGLPVILAAINVVNQIVI
jgi:hypothetical protein